MIIILLEFFLTSLTAFLTDFASVDYFTSVDRQHATKFMQHRCCYRAADLSETPVRSQALASEDRETLLETLSFVDNVDQALAVFGTMLAQRSNMLDLTQKSESISW